jgi:hypothetical protein
MIRVDSIEELKSIPIYFQLGIWRSGTTLLKFMLDAHPEIVAPTESIFIIYLKKKYKKVKVWDEKVIYSFIDDLYSESKFKYIWNVDREKLTSQFVRFKNKLDFASACKLVYLNYTTPYFKSEYKIIVAKNPIYFLWIDELKEIFPESKFIVISRDYKWNYLSRKRNKQDVLLHPKVLAWRWEVYYRSILLRRKQNLDFYFLSYEELTKNPSNTLGLLCSDFLKITYNDSMLDFRTEKFVKYFREVKKEMLILLSNDDNAVVEHLGNFDMQDNIQDPVEQVRAKQKGVNQHLSDKEIQILDSICYKLSRQLNDNDFLPVCETKFDCYKLPVLLTNSMYKFVYDNFPFKIRVSMFNYIRSIFYK